MARKNNNRSNDPFWINRRKPAKTFSYQNKTPNISMAPFGKTEGGRSWYMPGEEFTSSDPFPRENFGLHKGWFDAKGKRLSFLTPEDMGRKQLVSEFKRELIDLKALRGRARALGPTVTYADIKQDITEVRKYLSVLDPRRKKRSALFGKGLSITEDTRFGDGKAGLRFIEGEFVEDLGSGVSRTARPGSNLDEAVKIINENKALERYKNWNPKAVRRVSGIWEYKLSLMPEVERKKIAAFLDSNFIGPAHQRYGMMTPFESDIMGSGLSVKFRPNIEAYGSSDVLPKELGKRIATEHVKYGGFFGKGGLDKGIRDKTLTPEMYGSIGLNIHRRKLMSDKEVQFIERLFPDLKGKVGTMEFDDFVAFSHDSSLEGRGFLPHKDKRVVDQILGVSDPKERARIIKKVEKRLWGGDARKYLRERVVEGVPKEHKRVIDQIRGVSDLKERARIIKQVEKRLWWGENVKKYLRGLPENIPRAKTAEEAIKIARSTSGLQMPWDNLSEISGEFESTAYDTSNYDAMVTKYVDKTKVKKRTPVKAPPKKVLSNSRDTELARLIAEQNADMALDGVSPGRTTPAPIPVPPAPKITEASLTSINETTKKNATVKSQVKAAAKIEAKNRDTLFPEVKIPKGKAPVDISVVKRKTFRKDYPATKFEASVNIGGKRVGSIPYAFRETETAAVKKIIGAPGELLERLGKAKHVTGYIDWAKKQEGKEFGARLRLFIDGKKMEGPALPVRGVQKVSSSRKIIEDAVSRAKQTPSVTKPTPKASEKTIKSKAKAGARKSASKEASSKMVSKWFEDPAKLKKAGLIAGGTMLALWMLSRNASTQPMAGEGSEDTSDRSLYGGGQAMLPEGYRQAQPERDVLPTTSAPRVQDPQSYRMRVNVRAGSSSDMRYDVFGDQIGRTIADNLGVSDARVNMRVSDNSRSMSDFNIRRKLEQVV